MDAIAVTAQVFGVVVAVAAALHARSSSARAEEAAHAARVSARYQVLSDLQDSYADPAMFDAINKVLDIRRHLGGADWAAKFAAQRRGRAEDDHARRRVKNYFDKLHILTEIDPELLGKDVVMKLINETQAELLFEYIEPLENSINPDYVQGMFEYFDELFDRKMSRPAVGRTASETKPGFPIRLWYRTHGISSRGLILAGSDARTPPRRVTPCG